MIEFEYVLIRNYETIRTIPEHAHDCYELVYYIDGEGISGYGKDSFSYGPGTYLLITPNIPHYEKHEKLTKIIAVGFRMNEFNENVYSRHFLDKNAIIFNYIQEIRKEYKQKQPFFERIINNIIKNIVINIVRELSVQYQSQEDLLDYVISFINEYYMTNITIEQLAKYSNYCIDHFRTLFKNKTGLLPKDYILNLRINKAKELLTKTNKPLDNIALSCGFEYYSHFSNCFKKITGISPSEYRKKYKEI